MSETRNLNLASPSAVTNFGPPESRPDAGGHGTHIIDRLATWLGTGSAAVFLGIVWFGRDALAHLLHGSEAWLLLGLAAALVVQSGALIFRFLISPMVGRELGKLADAAEAVAAGDLTKQPELVHAGGQMGRLARALGQMTAELRELSGLLRESADETNRLSEEITSGTEHMAQAASGIAGTAATLSDQASSMAAAVQQLSGDATRLTAMASAVTTGAQDGISRNHRLRLLASENHARLDESAQRLEELAVDVRDGAQATEALARATEQIREFVTLVQKIARQSKLLALNAAMEAARAGEHGEGFAVVATEVRRLAASASEAASQTDVLVKEVLGHMQAARAITTRTTTAVDSVQAATEHGRTSFTQVEAAVAEAEAWTTTMAETAGAGSALANDVTQRLDTLTAGTQAFANAMQDVAAASEEQSASTEQIAAAASHLTQAAERVTQAAQAFRAT